MFSRLALTPDRTDAIVARCVIVVGGAALLVVYLPTTWLLFALLWFEVSCITALLLGAFWEPEPDETHDHRTEETI